MRIPDWSQAACPQPAALVDAITARRGGALINLDKALLWSEPLARGWNVYLKAVRTELATSREWRELAICTVALLTGAAYEYHHHAPDYLAAGGRPEALADLKELCADLQTAFSERKPLLVQHKRSLSAMEIIVVNYAAQMTLQVRVDDAVFEALRGELDTTHLVELTSAIATYNMVARFLVALGVSPETPAVNPP